MWLYLSKKHMEKNGQMLERNEMKRNRVTAFIIQACISIVVGEP